MAFLQNIVPTRVATADYTSGSITLDDALRINNMSMHVIAASLNTADAAVKIQHSNDNTNWIDLTDGSVTLTSSTSFAIIAPFVAFKYYRVVFTKGTNSAGTVQIILNFN